MLSAVSLKFFRSFGSLFAAAAAENNADFGFVKTTDICVRILECRHTVFRGIFQNGVPGFKTNAFVGKVVDVFQLNDQHGKRLIVALGAVEVMFQSS